MRIQTGRVGMEMLDLMFHKTACNIPSKSWLYTQKRGYVKYIQDTLFYKHSLYKILIDTDARDFRYISVYGTQRLAKSQSYKQAYRFLENLAKQDEYAQKQIKELQRVEELAKERKNKKREEILCKLRN